MKRAYFKLSAALLTLAFLPAPVFAAQAEAEKTAPKNLIDEFLRLPFEATQGVDKMLGEKIFNLGEIKVLGSRLDSDLGEESATDLPRNITVIGEKEIGENGAPSLAQMLNQNEGVSYSDELGQGMNARVDLRGFGGEAKQALVLMDGIRAVEPFDNSMAWHLYPKEYMEQVQIQRGGATIYGEGAFSGVIQMKTKGPTEDLHMAGESGWGYFGTEKYFAEVSDTVNGVGFYMGGRYSDTDGYRQNASQETVSSLLKTEFNLTEFFRVKETFYFADNETGIPGPLLPAEAAQNRRQKDPDGQFGDQFQDKLIQNNLSQSYYLEPLGVELSNQMGYRYREQDSTQSFGGFFPGTSINQIETVTYSDVLQAAWNLEGESYKSHFTTGAEWSIDDIHNPFTFFDFSFGSFESERSIDRRMVGIFAQERVTLWDRLILEGGVRWDSVNWKIYDLRMPQLQKEKEVKNVSPQAGVEWKFFDALSAYGSYSEAFKAPDSNTLIFETPNLFRPNPSVDPQLARHTEIGLRYAHPKYGSLRGDVFFIETKKEILFNDITNLNENFDTRRQGFEAAGEIAVASWLQFFSNYTYVDAEFDAGAFDGRSIPLVPQHKWSAGFVAEPVKNLTISGQATGVREQFALNDFTNRFEMENYWTLDGKVSYRWDIWEIYVRGENILGEEYSSFMTSDGLTTVNLNPAPAEYFELGVKIKI